MHPAVPIHHNVAGKTYEASVDGHRAVCDYELADDKMIFTHTFVPPELRGRGLAEQLVRAALADARAAGRKVVPSCSYVATFIQRNAEYQDLLG
jgi:predicted GNAT family acetyltransferase